MEYVRRLNSLDLLKGFGILSFIIWHCYDYFFFIVSSRPPFNRFILYTTGIFLFISGFIIGYYYFRMYINCSADNNYNVGRRLLVRAAKLALYVYSANFIINVLKTKSLNFYTMTDTLYLIVSLFYVDRWDVSFQILIVIALGLALSPVILGLYNRYGRHALSAIIIIILFFIFIDFINNHSFPYLWRYLPLSIVGTILGLYFHTAKWQESLRKYYFVFPAIFFSMCTLAAISNQWHKYILTETGPYIILNIAGFLAIAYPAYKKFDAEHNVKLPVFFGFMSLLGQYSLLIYFAHLIIIRIVSHLINGVKSDSDCLVIIAAIFISVISFLMAYSVDYLRKYEHFNKLYRIVFQ